MKSLLSKAGFEVETAASGEAALGLLAKSPKPDLIITDLNMPQMNGIDLIKAIRGMSGFRFTPILMLTTESQQTKRQEARSAGATGWLTKPVKFPDLLEVMNKVLPKAPA